MRLLALFAVALLAAAGPAAAARRVGPGPVAVAVPAGGSYSVRFHLTPNRATRTGTVSVALFRAGHPVSGARLRLTVRMLNMNMGAFTVPIPERSAGRYAHLFPVVGMSGRWGFTLDVTPRQGRPFRVALADRMLG